MKIPTGFISLTTVAISCAAHAGNVNRPQLDAKQAQAYSYEEVLKYTGAAGKEVIDPWNPLSDKLLSADAIKPDYVVDPSATEDGKTRFRNVQAAVDRAVQDDAALRRRGKQRVVIQVVPGTYHELLYAPPDTLPLSLIGSDAGTTRIIADLDAAVSGEEYARRFGAQFAGSGPAVKAMHEALKAKPMVETVGSAIAWIRNDGFQAKNITFENAYNKAQGDARAECPPGGCAQVMVNGTPQVVHHQAVAVMVDGADRVQFENVRFIGFQDTLFLKSRATGITTRSFFDRSYVEGDVDFIFGDTTAYFYRSEIKSLGDRSTSYVVAPATNYHSRYGFVFDSCRFTHDDKPNSQAGKFYLGRQWFHSQRCTPYAPLDIAGYQCSLGERNYYQAPQGGITQEVLETVGKTVILHSQIGAHINREHPWSNWNAPGTLAYRPVQYDSDGYWNNLLAAGIDPVSMLHYAARKMPTESFLAEFDNTTVP
ncbi:MAG TPA: pectinesterase family protein [Burkholderiaceae bacterium]